MGNEKSLAHTRWNCKYHIVFAPKYRRQVFYREKRRAIGSILRKLCEWKSVRILEAECCADGFAPIFPDICYHLTHYKPAAADIPVASDNP
ncbi:transposase, partial [Escherichia coli]|uniref:transposase n=6 Tax=Enterobacteriaceae TaxID=543 RepID=UPI0028781AF1